LVHHFFVGLHEGRIGWEGNIEFPRSFALLSDYVEIAPSMCVSLAKRARLNIKNRSFSDRKTDFTLLDRESRVHRVRADIVRYYICFHILVFE